MQQINMQIRGRLIPELRVNGVRIYLDPIKDPDLDPDPAGIDARERVRMPRRHRRSITRWNP